MIPCVKKIAKIQNLKFHNSLNNFGEDPLFGVNLLAGFSENGFY